ncbi:acidic leucine-rich nuclear phosphoprotein 32 family member E isoform X1 [Triticum aestivum]|uniref:acidic leucine-rich nuclear phosphoprotein 32 family member E isoform X1 n=2 Tax=Triticum TaxID=4564 RepID=UPI001D02ED4A|nr:acidic leucine-rich nuclear phosphoprotein 32 family member E-like isoform X1 [Triticum aestivum]
MAGSQPGESNGGATDSILTVAGQMKPFPAYAISLFRDYDLEGVTAALAKVVNCSYEVQMEAFTKALEQSKYSGAIGAFPNEGKAKDEEEDEDEEGVVDEDEEDVVDEDEDDEVDEDEEDREDEDDEILTPATDGQFQVPYEGERERKKPRLAEGFGCQAEADV